MADSDDDEEETTEQLQSEFAKGEEEEDDPDAIAANNKKQIRREEEETFWEENRNTNHEEMAPGKKSFGPDKIKGGRVPTKPPPPVDEDGKPTKASANRKARNMAKRKQHQKQSMQKRSGAS
mmetsp:Transcript_3010/g.6153  ORF Transcript_3010/g.6153 Transcript_3010/m.6153 type:complete len:122 (-) Transcript_3010:652-1017(-)